MRNDRTCNIFDKAAAAVLAVVMLVTLCQPVFAAEDDSRAGTDEGDVIVMFTGGSGSLTSSAAERRLGIESEEDESVKQVWNFDSGSRSKKDMSIALVSSDEDADDLAAKLRELPNVKYAEKDCPVHALGVSNDAYSDLQWSMQSGENTPNVPYEWEKVTGSDNVVAVVDTGVNYRHPDLRDNMWVNPYTGKGLKGKYGYDFISGNADPMDENNHGTHCAGIIGAAGDNGTGISGVNKKIRIMALRTLDADGSAMLSHEIAAYNYINKAIDLGVPVSAINNSWGGGEESEIFRELIDLVGSKGAVTVCAAGNDGANLDKYTTYPADIDSPYIITVAATREDGKLVSFSNYGKAVDLAAPGTDILSTVSYDCYNPGIYGSDQDKISSRYNSFDGGSKALVPDRFFANGREMQKNGNVFTDNEGRRIVIEGTTDGFRGRGLRISYHGLKDADIICAPVSYSLSGDFSGENIPPQMSAMVKTYSEKSYRGYYMPPFFSIIETASDDKLTEDTLEDDLSIGAAFTGDADYWEHISEKTADPDELRAGETRQFVYTLYASDRGDFTVTIDDAGISRDDLTDSSAFGKYDFYSGTSMAAPFVTGAVALKKAELQADGKTVNVRDLINEVCSMTKDEPVLNTKGKGQLDFRKRPDVLAPRISSAGVKDGKVVIRGSGLDTNAGDFCIRITRNGVTDTVTEAQGDLNEISFADRGWINGLLDIEVTANGSSYSAENVYLVDGKKEYSEEKDYLQWGKTYTTDGRKIYVMHSSYDEGIYMTVFDTKSKQDSYVEFEEDYIEDQIRNKYELKEDKHTEYCAAVRDAVYSNGKLYLAVEYGASDRSEDGLIGIYDGDDYLVRLDPKTSEIMIMDKIKMACEGYSMAAYDGRIYFAGGYSVSEKAGEDEKIALKTVKFYDPARKKWKNGKAMPQGRYGGRMLQSGGRLVYTLGHCEDESKYARNLVFDGSRWSVSGTDFPDLLSGGYDPGVGIVKNGLIYVGLPVEKYGDSFIYNAAKDRFEDSGYNLIREYSDFIDAPVKESLDDGGIFFEFSFGDDEVLPYISAVAADKAVFARRGNEDATYSMPVKSGFVRIKKNRRGRGSVKGPDMLPPGNDARIRIKAGRGRIIKSLRINGKKIKIRKNASKAVYTIRKIRNNANVSVVFARKG